MQARVRAETAALHGQGIKLQHFAAVFQHLPAAPGRQLRLFLYRTAPGTGLTVEEVRLVLEEESA